MIPLILLIACFVITFLLNKFFLKNRLSISFIGRLSIAIMLVFTGIAHFTKTELMIEMMPDIVPFKREMVYLTGILELAASAGLVMNRISKLTSILLIVFFLAVLPANIIGSIRQVELGGMEQGIKYLYFRIPLQLIFIFWVYYFGIRLNKS